MEQDKIKALYQQLKNDGFTLDDEKTFRQDLQGDKSFRQQIYNAQRDRGYDMGGNFKAWEGRLMSNFGGSKPTATKGGGKAPENGGGSHGGRAAGSTTRSLPQGWGKLDVGDTMETMANPVERAHRGQLMGKAIEGNYLSKSDAVKDEHRERAVAEGKEAADKLAKERIEREAARHGLDTAEKRKAHEETRNLLDALEGDPEGMMRAGGKLAAMAQQTRDRLDYQQETGKELRDPVYDMTQVGAAPILARDEGDNILRSEDDRPLVDHTTDETRVNTQREMVVMEERADKRKKIKEAEERIKALEAEARKIETPSYVYAQDALSPYADPATSNGDLESIRAAIENERELIRGLKRELEGGNKGFLRGLADSLGDKDLWTLGMGSLGEKLNAYRVSRQMEDGKSPNNVERMMLGAMLENSETQQRLDENSTTLYRAGKMMGYQLPFMLQIGLTGGYSALADIGVNAGKQLASRFAAKYGKDALVKRLGANFLRATGMALGEAAAGVAEAASTGLVNTVNDALGRATGSVTANEDGEYAFTGGDELWRAVSKALTSQAKEFATEGVGRHLPGMRRANVWMARNVPGARKVSRALSGLAGTRAMRETAKWLRRGGVHGLGGEILEEEIGLPVDVALGDMTWEEALSDRTQGDIVAGLALSIGAMRGLSLAGYGVARGGEKVLDTVDYHRQAKRTEDASSAASSLMTDQAWQPLKERIDSARNEEMGSVWDSIRDDRKLAPEEKRAAYEYMNSLMAMRGYNLGMIYGQREAARRRELFENVEPTGKSEMGDEYGQFKGNAGDAAAFLTWKRGGVAKGVFKRKGLGDVDLAWGNPNMGLEHIIERHVIRQSDFENVDEAMEKIEDVLKDGELTWLRKGERARVEKDGVYVIVAKSAPGHFVLTAYDKSRPQEEKTRSEADASRVREMVFGEYGGNAVQPLVHSLSTTDTQKGAAEGISAQADSIPVGKDSENFSGAQAELEESYSAGYNATEDVDLQDIKNRYEMLRVKMEDIFTKEQQEQIDSNPEQTIAQAPQEQRKAILDYANAKQAYDGMIQRVRDDIDSRVSQSNAMVDSRVNKDSGMVQGVTMKAQDDNGNDRRAYVVKGRVVKTDDGTGIDHEKSDKSIAIRYEDTGVVEIVSPSSILSMEDPLDPEEEKQTAAEAIRQQYAKREADRIDGKVYFNVGDTYTLTDENGQAAQVQVVPNKEGFVDNGDGTVNVSSDGGQTVVPMRKEDIQAMVDATNKARVAANGVKRKGDPEPSAAPAASEESATSSEYNTGDELELKGADGNPTRAVIQQAPSLLNGQDKYLVQVDSPMEGKVAVDWYTKEELDALRNDKPDNEEPPVGGAGAVVEESASDEQPSIEQESIGSADLLIPSALERIPKDEQGQPIYEQTDPETAWDALVKQSGGDANMAAEVANDMVADREASVKKLSKAKVKAGSTPAEKIAARQEQKRAVEQAKAELTHWKAIANTPNLRSQREMAERTKAEEAAAAVYREQQAKEKAAREEAERVEREALQGVPDMVDDTPRDARARGYRRVNGHKIDRQQPLKGIAGKEVSVKFSDTDIPKGNVMVVEADDLQPSHVGGQRNPLHFIDESQPKERKDEASKLAANKIASAIRPEEITTSVTAYTGAPSVNSRGEVIQGNNRSAALKEMWAGYPEQSSKYKAYLMEHAEEFGIDPSAIESMEKPVLVNMMDVSDDEAIRLGQFVAQDTESGGTERIKPKNIVQKMGDDIRNYANHLLSSTDEDMTFSELVDRNGLEVLKWMQRKSYISPTQYKSAFDSKGNLTAEAKNDLKGVMYQSIFQNGNTQLEEMFNALPAKAQKAILATAYRDYESPNSERMNSEIQSSIMAYHALSQDPGFADAKNYKEASAAVESWKRQLAFDDVTGESYLPSEKFSNFVLLLATMYKGQTQTFMQNTFKSIFDLVQGTQETTLFEEPDNTPRTLVDAINETLNNLREELPINENFTYDGQQRSNVLVGDSAASQQRRQGSDGSAPSGGRNENSAGTDDGNGRTGVSDNERRGQGHIADIEGRQYDNSSQETVSEINLSEEVDENGYHFVLSPNGITTFGEIRENSGLTPAPIKLSEGYQDEKGKGYGLIHIDANHGEQIRKAGFDSVEDFVSYVATNYDEDNIRVGKRRYNGSPTFLIQVTDTHDNTLFIEMSKDGSYWNVNSAGIFRKGYSNKKETVVKTEPQQPNNAVSTGSSLSENEEGGITFSEPNGEPTVSVHKDSKKTTIISDLGEKVAKAEEETDTNPTEAQKEAGNYKKGHVRIGQFDITVENPKGSVRRGTDANGKAWEQTMRNTYGYIRGTEGVDGDHIDVFLTNDIDGWSGRRVYIVDQYNEDGTFDEHKVMLGFNDEAEAQDAYLSNYEKGWEYKHKLVMSSVNLPDFEKWINSSHRKTKPFAEYKSVNKENVANEPNAPEAGFEIAPAQYTTKRGKVLDMFLVTFSEPLTKEQQRAAKELAKAEKGWYDRDKGGFMMRSEESARKLADTITDNEEAVSDAQPLSIADTRKLENPARETDIPVQETDNSEHNEGNTYGANNKLVSRERYEQLKARMRRKLGGQLNMGIDPEILAIGTEMAAYHIEAGARKFADYATHMIADLGDAIRPYLKSFYNGARDLPEVQESGLAGEMTPYEEVRTFDVANFDKVHSDALATAEMVVQEQEADSQADVAKDKLINQRNEQRRKEDEQTTADTTAIASKAEAVASQAESDIETATTEQQVNNAVESIDKQLDEVNKQLALLGYYEAEPVESDFNEAYGYMRNAEKKAVKDANNLAKRLVNDLGIDPNKIVDKKGKKRRSIATANIAPAGGDISIYLPLSSEANLYLSIGLAPTYERKASTPLIDRGKGGRWEGDNLEVEHIMYRIEQPNSNGSERYGSNNFADTDVTYSDLLKDIRRISKKYLPIKEEAKEEAKEESGEKNKPKDAKNKKKTVSSQTQVADLFGGLFDEEASSEAAESQDNELHRKFAMTVRDDMLAALDSGTKPYRSILDLRKRASGLGMEVDNDGRTDILLQELVEDGLVRAAREVAERHGSDSRETYDIICKLYEMQPTIAARSSNRIKMQQYSTPLPMAWNAARFAMSGKKGGKVLEPTAGNGMLVFAIPAGQVHANELDETRLDNLREQGFAQVTQQDATEPFEGGEQYDVVIANPPFGKREAVDYDGKLINGLDPQITLNALASMKDDGRAAIIIGGNMEYASNGGLKSMKPFFTYLYDHYNVKGVVDMDGSLYAKQGTTYPTRMILIDGRRSDEERAQTAVYPPIESKAIRKADSFDDLYDIIDEVINSKEKTNGTEILRSQQGQLVSVADQPSRNTDGTGHSGQSRKNDDTGHGQRGTAHSTESNSGRSQQVLSREHRTDTGNGETRRGAGGNTEGGSRGVSEPDVQRVGTVGVSTERVGLGETRTEQPKKRTLTEEKSAYRPHNSAFSLQSVAPAAMVEAMDNVLSQIEAENGNIDEFVRKELGYDTIEETHQALAAEQVDSVAMAIYQMKKGQALIIGDQTGVGKGRQMAALIRWAVKRGEKPIFITQKADLFSDIYRDLVDIGSGDLVPFIFNSDGAMVDSNGNTVHKPLSSKEMAKVFAAGQLPDEYDFAVLTYSQVNTGDEVSQKEAEEAAKKRGGRTKKSKASKDGKATPKATFLRAIAEDNYLFLDESHTAAGTSNTSAYLQSILRSAKAATFASATFAKRPDTMPLYAIRTAMSQAKVEPDKLIGIIEKGGVTLQEIMSRELTNAGQMVRRERDMSDVVTDWKTINDPATVKRARENYDRTIAAFNAIIKFQEDYVKPMVDAMDKELAVMAESAGIKRGTDKMGVENVPFASKTYNYTKQLMLALKVDAIANEVDAEIKAGRHPVIALESTMESSIKDYSAGEVIAEPTFSASLLRGLDTVMQYTIKDENGKEQHARYSPKQLGEAGEKAYYELQDFIRESTSDIFISPLDAIIERLHEMGYKVGELTGRNLYVERDNEDRVVVKRRADKDKKRMQREFNNGELDVLILNKSASTGISLHASEKFSDQRQRTMIIAQPLSDINDYMQMIGRIDRTGQVHRGYYINLGLPVPAENRFLMMLSTKLKSLNANTTTSQDSESNEVEAPDLLNKYGSQVVVEYLRDNPDIYDKMGTPLKKGGEGGGRVQTSELDEYKPQEDDARKITGYVALLTTQEQEEFYDDVVRRYNELIKYLNDTGNNDLKITVMPLRAKTLEKRVSSEGIDPTGANPFAQNSYVEQVEMDVLRKPMKAAEIRKTIEQVNKGKRPEDYIRQIISTIEKEDEARIAAEEARYERSKARAQEDIAKQTEKINRQQKRSAEEKQAAIADYVKETNENVEAKHSDNLVRLNTNSDMLKQRLHMFEVGMSYLMPDNLESMVFDFSTPAIFCGYKAKDSKITASTTLAVFATLDGRRRVEVKLSDIAALRSIYKTTNDNWDAARSTTLENWDGQIPTGTRKTGYIMTGNILQAIADTQDERGGFPGQLISYTDIDGNVHDGILMPDKWNRSMLKTSGAPIIIRIKQIKDYMPVASHDGKVEITGSSWAKMYYLTVPKTKKDGAVYYENKTLLRAVNGGNFYPYRGKLRADIPAEHIESVVKELSKLGVKVQEEAKEDDVLYRLDDYTTNEEEANDLFRVVDDASELERLNNEPTIKVYRAMSLVDGKLYPPMSKKIGTGSNRISQTPSEFGQWEVSDERPELVEKDGKNKNHIYIVKDNGKGLWVAYNPYFHTSRNPLNDQFAEAYQRPNLVTVEVEVPESELTSGYQAEGAKDPVGETKWNAGPVNRQLSGDKKRKVILSRWMRPVRIVPESEVAQRIAELIEGENVAIPDNTVTPSLLDELKKLGVRIVDGINKGRKKASTMSRSGNGALTDDDLSLANDPVSKLLGKSTRTAAQRRAFAERERQRMVQRVQELAGKLHLDNVDIVTDASTLQGNRAKAKGFYSRSTGRITIVIPNQTSVFDAEQTLLHEAVAHYGLRKLFGEHFDTFLDNVFQNADTDVRRHIVELAERRGWDFRTATEEYLASLAENTNFENVNTSWWSKIKELFLRMLHKIGFEGFGDFSSLTLSDNELRYLLWRSYENLAEPGRYRGILGEAADVAKQYELKVGNYALVTDTTDTAADMAGEEQAELRAVNERFNEQLEGLNKENAQGVILDLGYPSRILRSAGLSQRPIRLYGNKLLKKIKKHGFSITDVRDLPLAINDPIAVFNNYGNEKNRAVLTELKTSQGNVLVTIEWGKGTDAELNIVTSVFGKGNDGVVKWINNGYATYINKEKALDYLRISAPIAEAQDSQELVSAANIVRNFENPKVSGENVEENDDLYRDGDPEVHQHSLARQRYEERVKRGMFQMQEALQDSMLGLKEAMEAILRGEGKKKMNIEDVDGFENAYLGENRLSSVNKAEADAFAHLLFKPLLDVVAQLAPNEESRLELVDYMMAKHGLERNRLMAEREARKDYEATQKAHPHSKKTLQDFIDEYRKKDYAGLTALTGADEVTDAESEALMMVNDYEATHDTAALWKRTKDVSNAILSKLYETGMMSKETYDNVRSMYEYYIPLRGFDEKTSSEAYAYLNSKDSAFNAPIKTAKGRKSKADDPFAYMQSMAESAIMQGNRNKLVKQRFYYFALNHPSDLVSVSELWLRRNDVTDEWEPIFPDNINEGDTAEEVERKMSDFENKMKSLAEQAPDTYKHGEEIENIPYRVVEKRDLRQHQVVVKVGGKDYVLTINGNPRAAQAINGQTNPDNDISGAIGSVLRAGEWLNRELSALYTTRNPDFVVSNFIRDMLYANSMVWVKEGRNYALRFHRNYAKANPAIMKIMFSKLREGTLDMDNEMERMFYQFIMNGGETGYSNIRDIEKRKNDIRGELRKANGQLPIQKAWDLLGERFDEVNRAVENCARFAAFMTSREMGRTMDRSIYDAKEISVNFNKKGSGSKFKGTTGQTKFGDVSAFIAGAGRSLFVFWNAAIQGTTNFGRQVKRHPGKSLAAMATMFTLGAIVAAMGYGDDGDDDKNSYWNMPEYVRRSNLMFKAGDQWISIPLPVEFRALYGLGELMISSMSGKEHLTGEELAEAIASQISQCLPLDILEGGGSWKTFVPSSVKPIVEAYTNESWTKLPIYKDTPFNKDMPEWTKAYKSANKYLVGISATLNEASGGDKYTKGFVDINPAQVEHVLTGYFGGIANTIDRLTKMGETIIGEREYDPKSFLILNRLVKNGDERTEYKAVNKEYFRLKEEHDKLNKRLNNYENDTANGIFDYAEKIDFIYNSPEYRRYEIFENYRSDIEDLSDMLKYANEEGDKDEIRNIETQLNDVKKAMINDMEETRK